jgi:hypothetical protein
MAGMERGTAKCNNQEKSIALSSVEKVVDTPMEIAGTALDRCVPAPWQVYSSGRDYRGWMNQRP